MERFLLVNNKPFFDRHGVHTVTHKADIPDKSCVLFIGSHCRSRSTRDFDFVKHYFGAISSKPYTYIIILGKSDVQLNRTIVIPRNVKTIYANNTNFDHDKIKFLPIGCDFRSISSFSKASISNNNRPILCYCNFSLNTTDVRRRIYDLVKEKPFLTIEHMGRFKHYDLSRDDFFERLGHSKFVLCPRGNAIDTFRFYDTVYSGAIPIVVREQYHSLPFFKDVPILYLDSAEDFGNLTEEFLNAKYTELKKLKKDYYAGMDFNTLMHQLTEELR
jgi:hypothetical protein